MATSTHDLLRRQLEDRRSRLRSVVSAGPPESQFVGLLQQVDSALSRLDTEDYARCVVCHGHVDEGDLLRNPLLEYCLCDLTREQQRVLEGDLTLARRIQAALLPDPTLAVPGWEASYRYEPAGFVSGDFCDLWSPPDQKGSLFFAVGDVSGKGVAASLLMAHIQAAFRSLVGAGVPLAELVGRMSRQLLEASIPSHYATLACGRADDDGRVEIVNAGHCPPLILRRGGLEAVGATGVPVGLLEGHPYEVTRLRLKDAETLVLYTDGLTEAMNAGGEEYGPDRIIGHLSASGDGRTPEQIILSLRTDLGAFLGTAPLRDDLTLLAVRRSRVAVA